MIKNLTKKQLNEEYNYVIKVMTKAPNTPDKIKRLKAGNEWVKRNTGYPKPTNPLATD